MKNAACQILNCLVAYFLIQLSAAVPIACAAGTTLHDIREGQHNEFSRLVFDCQGARPESVGPAQTDFFTIRYAGLTIAHDLKKISARLEGAVRQIVLQKENSESEIRLLFAKSGASVKSFILASTTSPEDRYRLVVDVYPPPATGKGKKKRPGPTVAATTAAAPQPMSVKPVPAPPPAEPAASAPEAKAGSAPSLVAASTTAPAKPAGKPVQAVQKNDKTGSGSTASNWTYSAEASLILRAADGEDESSKFEEYRDVTQPVAGDLSVQAERDRRLYFKGSATGVGQDDPSAEAGAGHYGRYDIDLKYNRLIHRYALDARTLYSGVGSGSMTLDDNLQTALEGAADPATQAALLNSAIPSAALGDPETTRDRFQLEMKLVALDPLNFKIEAGHETREGTRPFAGAFSSTQMVELFEPIDYETTDIRISGEYAAAPLYLNLTYHFSQFTNGIDTLTFDNPLRATDAVGGPSTGRIDLAPDNQFHDIAFTGAWTRLPWDSQITANAAFGWMLQDDDLVPFTTNTAITVPDLPAASADAQVNTSLYNLRLTSRPLTFMRVKADLRYYDYDNQTDRIDFSGGYVDADSVAIGTAVTNLPSSYTKTRGGLDLGFDVAARTSLGVGYQFERTERENREVDQQDDNVIKATADTRALDWMDIHASYERTDRQIDGYNYNVYLQSGEDIAELPQMRKYDQADMVRDRYRLQATVYPMQALTLTGSFTYGKDDYEDSPYGLQKDDHYIVSFDSDYAIGDRATLNLFYTYEKYENTLRNRENGFGAGTEFDWTAKGEDQVNTLGGGVTLALIPARLDLELTYAYSKVDGNIAFSSPSGLFADFTAVDDTTLHTLNSKMRYYFSHNLYLTLGYLWEKFDYEDYNTQGFAYVPTDASGNYQGALLAGTLPQDYDAHVVYTQITYRYK